MEIISEFFFRKHEKPKCGIVYRELIRHQIWYHLHHGNNESALVYKPYVVYDSGKWDRDDPRWAKRISLISKDVKRRLYSSCRIDWYPIIGVAATPLYKRESCDLRVFQLITLHFLHNYLVIFCSFVAVLFMSCSDVTCIIYYKNL